ncbi:30S ribosomal protein S4 [Candidatus Saganbacteria bacterium]|nr:30S ribosomal protein S4 [Candidatus Saganbacteria bacterium]
MSRHITATCKLCRREKVKLFLKGDKCASEKCPFSRRSFPPGQHGKAPVRVSEYGIRLREKQKARRIYGLTEKQFAKYFDMAAARRGDTGEQLLQLLELRLDNVVYRLGFAASRQAARQLVKHGGVNINGRKANIPSFQTKINDVIQIKPKRVALVKAVQEKAPDYTVPVWLTQKGEIEGQVAAVPSRDQIDTVVEEQMIVEYYSR